MSKIKRVIKDCIAILSSGAFLGAVLVFAGILFYYIFLSFGHPTVKEYHETIRRLIMVFPVVFIVSLIISLFFTVIMYLDFRSRNWTNLNEQNLWRKIILWTAFIGGAVYYFQVKRATNRIAMKNKIVYKIIFTMMLVSYCG